MIMYRYVHVYFGLELWNYIDSVSDQSIFGRKLGGPKLKPKIKQDKNQYLNPKSMNLTK